MNGCPNVSECQKSSEVKGETQLTKTKGKSMKEQKEHASVFLLSEFFMSPTTLYSLLPAIL